MFAYQVKVTKGDETVIAVFNQAIPTWPYLWYSGKFNRKILVLKGKKVLLKQYNGRVHCETLSLIVVL